MLLAASLASCSKEEAEEPPVVCGPSTNEPPDELACTGLYADFRAKTIATTARAYAPGAALWSDGYDKSRWLELPEGSTIDTSNADEWSFPVGTKVWKEFRFQEKKLETRLLWKVAADRWVQAAYVWSEDGKSATRGEGRSLTVGGEAYDVPSLEQCRECHAGKSDQLLGIDAIALGQPAATGLTLATLAAEKRLSVPPAKTAVALDPGVAVLHVNCGVSCHNARRADSTFRLRVGFDEATEKPIQDWELHRTTVGIRATVPGWNGAQLVAPGAPAESVVVKAMNTRGTGQMPPADRHVDFKGVAAVEAWIRSLPPK